MMRNACVEEAGARTVSAKAGPPEDPADLTTWYRWGWVPLVGGCAAIVAAAMVGSEIFLEVTNRAHDRSGFQLFALVRGVVVSALLAAYAGWFVWRSRRRIEAAREALRRRTEEVRERERRVEQRVAMDAATRILAHEIRNPLNNMLLNCVVLERAIAPLEADRRERILQINKVLRGEIERLSVLSGGYLSGRPVELRHERLQLEALAADVIAVYRPEIEARKLRVEVIGGTTPIHADPGRLRQLLHNLVRNALEAVADRGQVAIRCAVDAGQATLEVIDDGPGFADIDRAFRLFHTTKEHGSGLGLAVVRDIARMHGGQVHASNGDRGGARVTVRLPAEARS